MTTSTSETNRDWTENPYGVEDAHLFEKFELDLLDELERTRGIKTVLWNAGADSGDNADWYKKIINLETPREKSKAGDTYLDERGDEQTYASDETDADILAERKELAKEVANRFYMHKLRDLTTDTRANNYKKLDNMEALVREERFALYFLLKQWTCGTVREEIQRLSKVHIEHARQKIAELFGKQTYDDTNLLLEQLQKGCTRVQSKAGSSSVTHLKMTEKENVITYFTDLEKLRVRLLNRIDSAQRDAYEPCLWPRLWFCMFVQEFTIRIYTYCRVCAFSEPRMQLQPQLQIEF